MNCPFCQHTKLSVTNKRNSLESIRRRRECLKCKKRFTTYEKITETDIYVIKKNKTRQKFDIEKVKKGLDRAFEKRPVSKEKINKIAQEIEEKLQKLGKKEINSNKIGEMIIKKIKKIDKIAYIRFASVYRDFKEIDEFIKEIKEL